MYGSRARKCALPHQRCSRIRLRQGILVQAVRPRRLFQGERQVRQRSDQTRPPTARGVPSDRRACGHAPQSRPKFP